MQVLFCVEIFIRRAIITSLLGSKICFKINRARISLAIYLILNRTNTSNIMDY